MANVNLSKVEAYLNEGRRLFDNDEHKESANNAAKARQLLDTELQPSAPPSDLLGEIELLQGAASLWVDSSAQRAMQYFHSAEKHGYDGPNMSIVAKAIHNRALALLFFKSTSKWRSDAIKCIQRALTIIRDDNSNIKATLTIILQGQVELFSVSTVDASRPRANAIVSLVGDALQSETASSAKEALTIAVARLVMADASWCAQDLAACGQNEMIAFHQTRSFAEAHAQVKRWMAAHKAKRDYRDIDPRILIHY